MAPRTPSRPRPTADDRNKTDRFVAAAAEQIAANGLAGASARSIASAAGAAASAINYNFGSLEQLFDATFAQGATWTAEWIEACRRDLLALPRGPQGAAFALEHVLTQWVRNRRDLALMYQEALAARAGQGPVGDWTRSWRDFWTETAAAFGLGEAEGRLLHLFFESEALYHLSTWSPPLEQAALREMIGHLSAVWFEGPAQPAMGALALAERTARVRTAGSIAPTAVRIAEAAAAVVQTAGLAGLTHRAVAAQAGVTTGSVTHHFRTAEDLVAGAVRGQVLALTGGDGHEAVAARSPQELVETLCAASMTDSAGQGVALMRRRLFLAALRRPGLAGPGAVIRFAHGGTLRALLDHVFDLDAAMLPLHAGVMSRLIAAMGPATSADAAATAETVAAAAVNRFVGRLSPEVGTS